MTSKARFETERQRERIAYDSVFGIWTDVQKTIRVRISPIGNSVRIRIVHILDPSIINVIAFFCGLNSRPKRSKWAHFDLVVNLVKESHADSYVFGEVHLPHAFRRTGASLLRLAKSQVQLNFLDLDNSLPDICTGSLTFYKESNWHNRRNIKAPLISE